MTEDAYEGDGTNLYAYCRNNPIKYYDPSGYSGEANEKGHSTPEGEQGKTPSAGTAFLKRLKNKIFKKIDVDDISYNPKDDVFTRGFNPESVSYHRKYYGENGRFNTKQEPIVVYDLGNGTYMMQGGHHRLKAAKDLGLKKIKVNMIISYKQSVKYGITQLPTGINPKD